jgi:3-hydroxymyristoyl/3-hydroxydecanoyl-(acyl carrier protein) dehydratase
MLEALLVVPVIEIFAAIAQASTMLSFWDGTADVL